MRILRDRKSSKQHLCIYKDPLFGNIKYVEARNVLTSCREVKDEYGNKNKIYLDRVPNFEFQAEFELYFDYLYKTDLVKMKVIGEDIVLDFSAYDFVNSLKFAKNNQNDFKLLDGLCSFSGKFYFEFGHGPVGRVVPIGEKK